MLTFYSDFHIFSHNTVCIQVWSILRYHMCFHPLAACKVVEIVTWVNAVIYPGYHPRCWKPKQNHKLIASQCLTLVVRATYNSIISNNHWNYSNSWLHCVNWLALILKKNSLVIVHNSVQNQYVVPNLFYEITQSLSTECSRKFLKGKLFFSNV